MNRLWCVFFMFWPIVAVIALVISPAMNWWFPYGEPSATPLGEQIDNLFYLILVIVTVAFVGTQIGLGYVLWKGAEETDERAWFSHGSHNLEVIWTIVPAGILLFIALYQMDVWANFRIKSNFPEEAVSQPIAEVTARQFEWRIRYPAPDRKFKNDADIQKWLKQPEVGDLYAVNDLHVPTGRPVMFYLRSEDVQHSFFVPEMRIKQDAVPGLVIPIWFETLKGKKYEWVCAELCGWGHYKMKAQVWAQPQAEYEKYLQDLKRDQEYDGFADDEQPEVAQAE